MSDNLHLAWARLFLRAAAQSGVSEVVLSPGSRSTPLAIEAAASGLTVHVVVDERAAGFFALGQARVTGRPSLLVCTSGTAGAHYLPAVIEAAQSFVPMLVCTADRPYELQDAAAPQTIDQIKLFGDFVRHFAELGLPDASPGALASVTRIAAQAVARSLGPTPGPVHVNARFRKPLEPVAVAGPSAWEPAVEALLARGPTRVLAASRAPDAAAMDELAARLAAAERGVIVCGPAPASQAEGRDAILELARTTGFPLFAEGPSQVRFGGDRAGVVTVSSFDALLRARGFVARHAPEVILELGAPPTSGAYAAFLGAHANVPRFVVAAHGWNDPTSRATALVEGEPAEVAREIVRRLPKRVAASSYAEAFARADAVAGSLVERAAAAPVLSEGAVARSLVSACPERATLVIGNSTPVRDLDAYCPASSRALTVLHQRGASGIDGLVSGAAGARSVSTEPIALLLGDVSLLHDLTGLVLARRPGSGPFVIVVVNNGGGRIFDQLPIAGSWEPELFERYFATHEAVRFSDAAAAFGVGYACAQDRASLDAALAKAFASSGATLIEALAPPRAGAVTLKRIWSELATELG